jgi:hypothetical protein
MVRIRRAERALLRKKCKISRKFTCYVFEEVTQLFLQLSPYNDDNTIIRTMKRGSKGHHAKNVTRWQLHKALSLDKHPGRTKLIQWRCRSLQNVLDKLTESCRQIQNSQCHYYWATLIDCFPHVITRSSPDGNCKHSLRLTYYLPILKEDYYWPIKPSAQRH